MGTESHRVIPGVVADRPDLWRPVPEKREAVAGRPPRFKRVCRDQLLTVMPLLTDFTPRTSWASLVTRDFSASEAASPLRTTLPSVVTILSRTALVDFWLISARFTWEVIEASSI